MIYGIPGDDLMAVSSAFMEEPAWFDRRGTSGWSVLLKDRLRGGRAEIWTSSSLVLQHITLINHLNASFSGPLAWTAAQNKEIESHLNQGVQSRTYMKWALSECTAGEYQSGRDGRRGNWLKEMRDTERQLIQVWKKSNTSKIHPPGF